MLDPVLTENEPILCPERSVVTVTCAVCWRRKSASSNPCCSQRCADIHAHIRKLREENAEKDKGFQTALLAWAEARDDYERGQEQLSRYRAAIEKIKGLQRYDEVLGDYGCAGMQRAELGEWLDFDAVAAIIAEAEEGMSK